MMEYLPREIVLDILSRLPVTSLLQLKLVCRAWNNLIQDHLLVTKQFFHTANDDPCLIMHCDHDIQNQLYSLELSDNEDDQRVNKISVPEFPEFEIKGSCKGLLCMCGSWAKDSIYVYNPFIRKYMQLPKSMAVFWDERRVFGFGFNPTRKEYKVIKIAYRMAPRRFVHHIGTCPAESEVQVFTLGSTAWKSLGKMPYYLSDQGPLQALVNGRLHWSSFPKSYHPSSLLISFDLEDEQFREVPIPDSDVLERANFDVLNLGGSLSMIIRKNFGELDIWVMKEYSIKESWIKEFRIRTHFPRGLSIWDWNTPKMFIPSKFYGKSSNIKVIGLLKNGKVLLEYKCRALVTYDQKDGTFKDLDFPGMPYWFEAFVHEGTLGWIDTSLNHT